MVARDSKLQTASCAENLYLLGGTETERVINFVSFLKKKKEEHRKRVYCNSKGAGQRKSAELRGKTRR